MDAALDLAWSQYHGWARRARVIRRSLDTWRFLTLTLTVSGAALATLSTQWPRWYPSLAIGGQILSAVSGVAMAAATWATRSMLDTTTEKTWICARALAERAKSEAFRYASCVSPYDGDDAASLLLAQVNALMEEGKDVAAMDAGPEDARKKPVRPLSTQQYIELRYDDQVKGFFGKKSGENERKATLCTRAVQALSAAAALLGGLGTLSADSGFAIWIATLSAVSSSIGAFALAKRYQGLAATYRLAADQMRLRYAAWSIAAEKGAQPATDRAFIKDTEDILSIQNQAWVAESTKRTGSSDNQGGQHAAAKQA